MAMIVARILDPRSKLATARGLDEETSTSTLAEILEVQKTDAQALYTAMDWLGVSGGVNMYWNRRDKSRRGELAVGAAAGGRQCHTKCG